MMIAPSLPFNSSKEVSHKTVLNVLSMLECMQVDLELNKGRDQIELIAFPSQDSYNAASTQSKCYLSNRIPQHVCPVTTCTFILLENAACFFSLWTRNMFYWQPTTHFSSFEGFYFLMK